MDLRVLPGSRQVIAVPDPGTDERDAVAAIGPGPGRKGQRLVLRVQPRGLGALALEVAGSEEILVRGIRLDVEGEVVGGGLR